MAISILQKAEVVAFSPTYFGSASLLRHTHGYHQYEIVDVDRKLVSTNHERKETNFVRNKVNLSAITEGLLLSLLFDSRQYNTAMQSVLLAFHLIPNRIFPNSVCIKLLFGLHNHDLSNLVEFLWPVELDVASEL